MTLKKLIISINVAALLVLTQACSQANSNATDNDGKVAQSSPQDLYAQIQQTANAEGCTSVSDCALLPIGNKPCGGPEDYMAYSTTNSDVAKLKELGQQYTEQRRQYNKENQIIGTCVVTPKPGLSCVRNQCVTTLKQRTQIK